MDTTTASKDDFCIADHKLIRCIGRGSYGQVWLAQSVIGAYRAVKVIRRKDFEDEAPYQRELNGIQRFEPISRSHPGFIHVLQVGQDEARGYFYYVMELGDDASGQFSPETYSAKTIESVLRSGKRLSVDEVIRFGLRLTDALYTLHERGLIHRDIKPSNILFVGGIPKLADIGLVTSATEARSLVGTPGYIPPEGPGTKQADVYALGKVFYECLTGLDRNQFPDLPSFFDGHSQEARFLEINEVISRACHHDLAVRYPSAREFHAELTAIENGESVVRLHELERKWARAKRWSRLAAFAALVLGSLVFAIVREWTLAGREKARTIGLHIGSSLQAVQDGSYAKALRDTAQVLAVAGDERSQQVNRLRFGSILSQMPKLVLVQSYGTRVWSAEFTPDGEGVLIALGDGRCQLIDGQSGKMLVNFIGHTNAVASAIFSPDGQYVATAGMDGTARIWDRRTGRQMQLFRHPRSIAAVDFHPHKTWLVAGAEDGMVSCWNTTTEELVYEFRAHNKQIECVRFSHNGKLMVTAGRDNQARIWNSDNQQPVGQSIRHSIWVTHAAFSPDDQQLVTGCHDNGAYVWAVESQRLIAPPIHHERAVRHVEFSPDGRYILTSGWDNTVRQWNPSNGKPEGCALRHSSPVMCATYSPDGRRIVTGCIDGTLRVWDQAGKDVPRVLHSNVNTLSGDGNVYWSRNDTNLDVYITTYPDAPKTRIAISGKLRGAFLSKDGNLLATVTEESAQTGVWCQVWPTDSSPNVVARFRVPDRSSRVVFDHSRESLVVMSGKGTEMVKFGSGSSQSWPLLTNVLVTNAVFSTGSRSVALVAGSGVFVFDIETHQLRFERLQHRTTVRQVSFSPDGRYLVTCTANDEIQACVAQVWDAFTGTPVGTERWHADGVEAAAWFPDNQRFITVGEDGVGRIWFVLGEAPIGLELKHDHQIDLVEVGSASGLILTAGQDLTTRLWDQESLSPVGPPVRFPRGLQTIRFSSRDAQVVAHNFDGVLFLIPASSTDWSQPILTALALVLDGRLATPAAGDEFQTGKIHASEWQRLKGDLPAYFKILSKQIVAWHRLEAEQCRTVKHRRGELFHLNHLLRLVPDDRYLISRREYVQKVLAAELNSPVNRN